MTDRPADDVRQLLVHPAVWPHLTSWLAARGIDLSPTQFDSDDLPTYVMTPGCEKPTTSREEALTAELDRLKSTLANLRVMYDASSVRVHDLILERDALIDERDSMTPSLSRAQRLLLGHALGLTEERMEVHPGEYDTADRAALTALRLMTTDRAGLTAVRRMTRDKQAVEDDGCSCPHSNEWKV